MATTVTSQIVNLVASVVTAPAASHLQRSGALISVGGTTLTTGTYQYISAVADLTAILGTSGNYVELGHMATTFFAQGSSVGCYVLELGAGTDVDAEIQSLQTWINDNPGVFYAYLCPSTWDGSLDAVGSVTITNAGSGYTTAPTVTFDPPTTGVTATGYATISNGSVTSVVITNPGSGYTTAPNVTFSAPTTGTTATGTANLSSALNSVCGNFSAPTSKTYFFITAASANVGNYAGQKAAHVFVPSPTAASTEFGEAVYFYQWLANNPGPASVLAPMAYRYAYGVTPWTKSGNTTTINTILTAYANIILTGAEGGISNSCLFKGTFMDGTQMSWWYGIDWYQINATQALAAAIINGSNSNPPLLYNQTGINSLLAVAQQYGNTAVSYGCALSVSVSADSFYDYTTANPSDYAAGVYNGLAATIVGPSGFLTITFNLTASQLVLS